MTTMNKQNDHILSSYRHRLKSSEIKAKIRFKNRSPLRDLTKSASRLLNATTTKAANRKSNDSDGTPCDHQEWTQKPVVAALNPAPSLAFPPPPSAISPNRRRYPSPPSYTPYDRSVRESASSWVNSKPRAKSNDRGMGSSIARLQGGIGSSLVRPQGGIGSLRKSAIRDVLRRFKCDDNTRVNTTVSPASTTIEKLSSMDTRESSIDKRQNLKSASTTIEKKSSMDTRQSSIDKRQSLKSASTTIEKQSIMDTRQSIIDKRQNLKSAGTTIEKKSSMDKRQSIIDKRQQLSIKKESKEKSAVYLTESSACSKPTQPQQQDYDGGGEATKRTSYDSSNVSLTLLRVEIVGLKSEVCDMEAQVAEGKSALNTEKQRHQNEESRLQTELEELKTVFREEKVYLESQIREIDAGVKESQRALGKEKLKHQEVNSQLDRFHIAKSEGM